jgi:ankyrin repeat protein
LDDPDIMELLLDWYGKVASKDPEFFFEAARQGNSRRMDALLSHNPDLVHATDTSGRSGLHWAAIGGHVPEAERILAGGGTANLRDNGGKTPSDLAIENGHKEMAYLLLTGKLSVEKTDVYREAPPPSVEMLEPVFEALVPLAPPEVTGPETTSLPDNPAPVRGETKVPDDPLFEPMEVPSPQEIVATDAEFRKAVIAGDPKQVEALLRRNPGLIHSRDTNLGWTPLHWAVERKHHDVVQMLVFWGADLNAKEVHGWTPLRMARKNGDRRIFNLLLNHGATE